MTKYKVLVHPKEWLTFYVEAKNEADAKKKVCDGKFDGYKCTNADYTVLEIEEVKE